MEREELIEKAAQAIHSVAESGASWLDARMADKDQHRAEARAALAVFEKAHAPAGDRRARLTDAAAAFRLHPDPPTWEEDPVGRDAALRWHLRGFDDGLNARRMSRFGDTTMGEQFVPSTQDVRDCYAALGSGPTWDERVREFDRWMDSTLRLFTEDHEIR